MHVRRLAGLALALARLAGAGGVLVVSACGGGAVDVDGCKQIEEARCRQAPACGIPIEPPYFTSDGDVDACIRFYDDACLHGLAVSDPGPTALAACVSAIQGDTLAKDGCSVVKSPQTDVAACGWLAPTAAVVDAAATDAATTADSAAD
jgi:hypothetical protein